MTFRMKARRAGWLLIVAAFAFGLFTGLRPSPAQAYGLVSTRSIEMSSSIDAATGVIYTVGFTTATAGQNLGAMVIHFCSNDPIIGDSCTAPTSFNDNFATLVLGSISTSGAGGFTTTGWSIDRTNSKSNAIIITRAAPFTSTTGTNVTFNLGDGLSTASSMTNPDFSATNPSTTFFARITLYSSTTPSFVDDTTAKATEKTAFDAGGVAMSTDTTLSLTAKVQEQLTFCVYTTATCAGGANNGVINLGDTNGVLAATNQNYMDASTHWDLASNALGGVIVRIKGDTLRSGTFTIDPQINAGTCAADSTSTSVEQFGVRVVTYGAGQYNGGASNATTPNSGNVDDYSCLAGSHYWNLASTNTTYGEPFVRTFGATDSSNSNIEFAAKAANTTEAGVYKSTIQLIATATY